MTQLENYVKQRFPKTATMYRVRSKAPEYADFYKEQTGQLPRYKTN